MSALFNFKSFLQGPLPICLFALSRELVFLVPVLLGIVQRELTPSDVHVA